MRLVWTVKLCLHSFDWIWLPVICIIGFGDIIGSQFPQGKLGSMKHELSLITFCFFWLWIWLVWISHTSGITECLSFFGLVYFTYYNDHKVRRHCSVVRITDFGIIFHCMSTTVCLWSGLPWTLRLLLLANVNHAVVTVTAEACIFSAPFPIPFGYIAWIRIELWIYSVC